VEQDLKRFRYSHNGKRRHMGAWCFRPAPRFVRRSELENPRDLAGDIHEVPSFLTDLEHFPVCSRASDNARLPQDMYALEVKEPLSQVVFVVVQDVPLISPLRTCRSSLLVTLSWLSHPGSIRNWHG
jgi:hypothetical protein